MGAGNAQLVLLAWSRYLGDVQVRVAMQMALTSLDGAQDVRYWAGWAPLATAAGKDFPAECAPTPGEPGCRGCDDCAAARKCVVRAIRSLIECGFCALVVRPRPGKNAEYQLFLHGPQGPCEDRSKARSRVIPASGRRTSDVLHSGTSDVLHSGRLTSCVADVSRPAEEDSQEDFRNTDRRKGLGESPRHLQPAPEIPEPRKPPPDERTRQLAALEEWIRNHPEAS